MALALKSTGCDVLYYNVCTYCTYVHNIIIYIHIIK